MNTAPAGETARLPAEGSPYSRHIPALDGLRAFAVVGVMGNHLFPGNPTGFVSKTIAWLFAFGVTGVDLFFVLSGFLITGILFDSLYDPRFFRKFYARRVLRIFPLYYGILALFLLLSLLQRIPDRRELLSFALYLQNTSWIANPSWALTPPRTLPLSHFWSLAVEEQFYLVWPFVVWLVRGRRPLLWICVAAALGCPVLRALRELHGASYQQIHSNTLCRADTLLAGGALALALRSPRFHDAILQAVRWLYVALLPVLVMMFGVGPKAGLPQTAASALYPTFLLCFYAAVLASALQPGWFAHLSSQPLLRWIGKYSYGLYIYHLVLFHWIDEPMKSLLSRHIASKGAVVFAVGITVAVLSVLVAYLSYELVERRFLRLKRFFDYRRHPDTVAA